MSAGNIEIVGAADSIIFIAKLLKEKPKIRKYLLIISTFLEILSIVGIILNAIFFSGNQDIFTIITILLICFSFIILICAISYFINDSNINTIGEQLVKLAKERNELNKKIQKQTNVMDVIKINLNQLNEYYTINKGQARKSYSFSIIMITVGFIAIIGGIILWYGGKTEINIAIISSASGLIAEFIGATSLLLYKENSKQAQLFFDKLSYLQHVMLAIELSERLKEDNKEDKIASIISALIQKESSNKNK